MSSLSLVHLGMSVNAQNRSDFCQLQAVSLGLHLELQLPALAHAKQTVMIASMVVQVREKAKDSVNPKVQLLILA